jgi:hypothetical protein
MKPVIKFSTYCLLLWSITFTSCKKENQLRVPADTHQPPVAIAGTDQTITLPTNSVTLDGSASTDPDNNIASYIWTKIFGPSSFNISITNKKEQAQVTNLVEGVYQFELTVKDAGGLFSKDTIKVKVNSVPDTIQISGNEITFNYLEWQDSAFSRKVFMQTPLMPNGFSIDKIGKVYVFGGLPFSGATVGWNEIKKDGTQHGVLYYKIENNRVVVYMYYNNYDNLFLLFEFFADKVKILFV